MVDFTCDSPADVTAKGEPPMFWGLGSLRDFEPPRFIDWARQARRWQHGGVFLNAPYLNANGDLVRMPSGGTSYATLGVRYDRYDLADGPKTLKVTWDGDATVSVLGNGVSSVDTSVPGQITFVFNAPGTTDPDLEIRAIPTTVDGSGYIAGDPIRIYCIDTDYEAEWNAGEIFLPYQFEAYDEVCLGYRFMDWLSTNGNTLTSWADRPLMTAATYAGGEFSNPYGCPIELCIALCNRFQKHMWFHIPHGADDTYIQNAAELIRDTLDSNLHVYPVLSNEFWNISFTVQRAYAEAQALADFGPGDYWAEWQSKRSTQMAVIFRTAFAGQLQRLHPVLESKQGDTALHSRLMDPAIWQSTDPGNYIDPKTVHEYVAVSGYFYTPGWSLNSISKTEGQAIWDALQVSEANAITTLMGYLQSGVDTIMAANHAADADVIQAAGLRLATYEAQTHVRQYDGINTALYQANWRVEDATAYPVGETVTAGTVSGEVLSASGSTLVVGFGEYPPITASVVGDTSGTTQAFTSRLGGTDASGFIVGEVVDQIGGNYTMVGEVMPGTGGTDLVVKATGGTGNLYWRLNAEAVVGRDSGASMVPGTNSTLYHVASPKPGVEDMFINAYSSAEYGTVLTNAIAAYRAAGGTIWNQFVDMSRYTRTNPWGTMPGHSGENSGVMEAVRLYCANNPRDFFL